MNPRVIKNYHDALFVFVKQEELMEGRVYACSQNVPTIGVGYALAEKGGGTFTIRGGLDEDLAKIGETLTSGDRDRLVQLCKMLNDGTIREAIKGNRFKDPFDLRIDEEQAKQLFLICVPKYDAVLRQRLGLALYKELENSREMVTLFSLAYNAPSLIGKNLVKALKEGNRAKVQYEILYDSNRKRDLVLYNRRKREATKFGRYDEDIPTAEELNAEEEVRTAHSAQMAAYENDIDTKRKGRSAKKASGVKTASKKSRSRQQPGTAPNQMDAARRVFDVKATWRKHWHTIFETIIDLFGDHDKVTYRNWSHHPAGFDDQHYHRRWS